LPTAAIVVIGDEILSGKVVDANSPWLAKQLRVRGVDLIRVSVVPDELDAIADEVARASALADHVFTSGGVGPTHDDVTLEGIAQAFGVGLARHPELETLLRGKTEGEPTAAALRMAEVPEGVELWWEGELYFPVIVMRNVHIFPGVPVLLRRKFTEIADRFSGEPISSRSFTTLERESLIAARLSDAQARWPMVAIGSYPQFDQQPWTVSITMDSRDLDALAACESHLRACIEAKSPA
jgi:molybdenum cofactor synthesis domain-containing protein